MNVGDGIGAEFFEDAAGDVFQGGLVGGFEDDGCTPARIECLFPARGADAPAVAGFEPGESVFGPRGAEVVSGGGRICEELLGDHGADGVAAVILGTGIAVSGIPRTGTPFSTKLHSM